MHKYGYSVIGIVALLLYFVAIGYHGWNCSDSILGPNCRRFKRYEITGSLLVTAAFLMLVGVIFTIADCVKEDVEWTKYTALAITLLAAIFAIAAMIYYFDELKLWSPFIATFAMTLTVSLVIMFIFDITDKEGGRM